MMEEIGNRIFPLKSGFSIGYGIGPKVSANLGFGIGIRPKKNSGFGRTLQQRCSFQALLPAAEPSQHPAIQIAYFLIFLLLFSKNIIEIMYM